MKKVLITGGAGFIGSHLSERFIKEGYLVTVLDNLNDYYSPEIKKKNLNDIGKCGEFKFVCADIRDKKALSETFSQGKFDIVVHLAALAGVRPSLENPEAYYDVNIMGTLNILEEIRKNGIKKFVFASSSSVYGNNKKVPFSESDNVDTPISPYAASKKAGELLIHTYHHLYDISAVCLRFFTVYGPRQRPDLAIHKFTRLISRGEEIPFYGEGDTKRDYTYIDDIINGVFAAAKYVCDNEKVYEIINLGESRTVSLSEMKDEIEKALGIKAKLKKMPLQPGDVYITYSDVSKAKALLGYSPSTDFSEGIKRFVSWYNEINK